MSLFFRWLNIVWGTVEDSAPADPFQSTAAILE